MGEKKTAIDFLKLHNFATDHDQVKLAATMMELYTSQQCTSLREELAFAKRKEDLYTKLLIALNEYVGSISGRDIVCDKSAFERADSLSNELESLLPQPKEETK